MQFTLPLVICALAAAMAILNPAFLTPENIINIATQSATITLVAIGMTLVILVGGIDLAVGGYVALTGVVLAVLVQRFEIAACIAVLCTAGVGTTLGLVAGAIIGYARVPPFIATLGMLGAARGLTLMITDGRSVAGFDQAVLDIAQAEPLGVPLPIFIVALVAAATTVALRRTIWGMRLYAVGGNARAAWLTGIPVPRYHLTVYAFSGFACALAGVVLTSRLNSALPTAGMGYELDAIAAVVIGGSPLSGGRGSVLRTVGGAVLLGILRNGLTILNTTPYLQQVLIGLIVVAAAIAENITTKGD